MRCLRFFIVLLIGALMMGGAGYAAERIRTFDEGSLERIKARHIGRPYVVMVWSLDCAYCEESFKTLAQLQRKHGIKVITVTMDRVTDNQTAKLVQKKIRASGLKSEMWGFGSGSPEQLRYWIDPKWRGEMPRTYWHTKKGNGSAYSGLVTLAVAEKFM